MTWRSAIFDKMLATDETQTLKRKMLLMKLTHALDKHAHQEEMVVYPALREANQAVDADQLEGEHGYIKTFIYELKQDGPGGAELAREGSRVPRLGLRACADGGRAGLPAFKQRMTEEQNDKITEPREPRRLLDGVRLADEGELRRFLDGEVDAALAGDALDACGELGVEREIAARDRSCLAADCQSAR